MRQRTVRAIVLLTFALALGWLLIVGIGSRPAYAALCQSQQSGNWSDPNTWTDCGGYYPGQTTNDYVRIRSGHTVTLNISPGALYFVEIESGGTLIVAGENTLKISASGGTPGLGNNGTFNAGSGTVEFNTDYGSASSSVTGAVVFNHVTISGVGVDFGGAATVNGVLTINFGGWVTSPPTYGPTSTLRYNTGGIYGRGAEWSATSGPGYPNHVQIGNNTALDLGANGGTATPRAMAGNLTIDAGSALYMDYGANDMTAPLTVGGDVTNNGTLSLSELVGGDLLVGGNWTNNGTFNCRGRQVTFNGSGPQTVGGSATTVFDYLLVDNAASGNVTLTVDIAVRRELKVNDSSAELSAGSSTLTLLGDAASGPVFWNNGTFNRGTGTVVFSGENNRNGRVLGSAVTTFSNVTLLRNAGGSGNFGVDFYDHDTGRRAHVAGMLTLNQFTFVASEEDGSATGCSPSNCDGTPFYDPGSTLRYNNSSPFASAAEWWPDDATPTCGTDKGMPYNVVIENATALDINAGFSNNGREPNYPAGSNKTACGSVTIASGSTLTSTAGILSVKNDWTRAGSFIHNNGTVRFNGSSGQAGDGKQTISGDTTFYDLVIDPGANVAVSFVATTTTIVHDLSKGTSGGTMDPGTGRFVFTGIPSNILGDGKKVFYDLEIAAGGTTYHTSGAGDIYVYRDLINNGTFYEDANHRLHFDDENSGVGSVHALSGSGTTTFGRLQVWTSDTLNAGSHSFRVVGDEFWVASGATFNGGSATVTFQNASPGTDLCGAGAYDFYHLTIDTGATLLGVDTTGNNKTFYVAGNWTNNGTYTHNSGTVVFNGTSPQTIGGSNTTVFYALTINNSAGVNLAHTEQVDRTLTLSNGLLTLGPYDLLMGVGSGYSGTPGPTRMVVADGSGVFCREFRGMTPMFTFPIGDNTNGANYSPVRLSFYAASTWGPACVRVTDAKHPANPSPTDYLTRYWTVTSRGIAGFNCTAQFYYVAGDEDVVGTEENMRAMKYDSGVWTYGDPVITTSHEVRMEDITGFSDFTAGTAPTAVKLLSFSARPAAFGIRLTWETVAEFDSLGFDLYRSSSLQERGEKVNATLILSRSPGGGQGASYEFLDLTARPGGTYYYTLEDVDLNGRRTPHGPAVLAYYRVYLPLALHRR